jgi:hypothetical protein
MRWEGDVPCASSMAVVAGGERERGAPGTFERERKGNDDAKIPWSTCLLSRESQWRLSPAARLKIRRRSRGECSTASRRRLRFGPPGGAAKWDRRATCPWLIGRSEAGRTRAVTDGAAGRGPGSPWAVDPPPVVSIVVGDRRGLIRLRSPEHHGTRGHGARTRGLVWVGPVLLYDGGWLLLLVCFACSCTFRSRRKEVRVSDWVC